MNSSSPSAYGLKQGSFHVDANGCANYTLPIDIPPGIGGAQPHLKLVYNSMSGNGMCGVGWSLSGLSSITRTNAIMAIDAFWGSINYDKNDRLCLDGQRLINITGDYGQPGTIYYAEKHNWQQIVANETGEGFTVYMKNGDICSYGTTTNSLILASGTQQVREWALASVEDTNGNIVEYQYYSDAGAYYISKILYTSNGNNGPNFSVVFNYTQRPDEILTYLGGESVQTNWLLTSIQTVASKQVVRNYVLLYHLSTATQLSRLTSIIMIDGEGNWLPPIEMSWQDVTEPSFDTTQPSSLLLNAYGVVQTLPADVNGDGITDILQFYLDDTNNGTLTVTTFLAQQQDGNITYTTPNANGQALGYYGSGYDNDYQVFVADVNGDSLADIIVLYQGGHNNQFIYIDVYINTGSEFLQAQTIPTQDVWLSSGSLGFFPMDVNGDGRIDLVQAYVYKEMLCFNTYLSQFEGTTGYFSPPIQYSTNQAFGSAPTIWPVDVNNDGMVDLVVLWQDNGLYYTTSFITTSSPGQLNLFTNSVASPLTTPENGTVSILPIDVNGDGIIDILQITEDEGNITLQPFFSNAAGNFIPGDSSKFSGQYSAQNIYPLSLNGSAQTNVIASWVDENSNWNFTVFSSTPTGIFTQGTQVNTNQVVLEPNFFAGDANGDGKADLFYIYTDPHNNIYVKPLPSAGEYPDLLSNITDQLGNSVSIAYSPLTNGDVYSETLPYFPASTARRYPYILSPAQFPTQMVLGKAMYVVANYSFTNNASLNRFTYNMQYQLQYRNARIDLTGRGWQGFEEVTHINTGTELVVIKQYLQAYPYTGVLASQTKLSGTNLMLTEVYTYQSIVFPGQGNMATSAAYQVQKTGTLTYYYNGSSEQFDSLIAKSYTYDNYGNQASQVWWGYVSHIDIATVNNTAAFPAVSPLNASEVVYRYRQYQNDILASGWALGYKLFEKQTANTSDSNIQTFNEGDYTLLAFTYTEDTYNLASSTIWDNQNNCMLTTTFQYDAFGNKIAETKPGGYTTQYTYESTYNAYIDTMTAPANMQGVRITAQYGFDPRFGTKIAISDANGFISFTVLDGFGRRIMEQGPVPAGCTGDQNACTSLVTGSAPFTTAQVLTLENTSYLNDGNAGIYAQTQKLQQFPTGSTAVFDCKQIYLDGMGRIAQNATQIGNTGNYAVILTTYGANGKAVSRSLPFFSTVLMQPIAENNIYYAYDALGRLLSTVVPSGENNDTVTTSTWVYDTWQQTTATKAAGTAEEYVQVINNHYFNGKHYQIQSIVASNNNATTTFVFDALGRMISSTDPQGIQNTITYDSLGRKTTYNNPDQNTLQNGNNALAYVYNSTNGNLTTITDASGSTVNYAYDGLCRIISETYSDGRVAEIVYDTAQNGMAYIGTVTNTLSGNTESAKQYGYDIYGNEESVIQTIGDTSYNTTSVFDPQKRVVTETYYNGMILTRSFEAGLLTSQKLGEVTINYPLTAYTANGHIGAIGYMYDTNQVLSAVYTYNAAGLLYNEVLQNQLDDQLLDINFTYDELYQLTESDETVSGETQTYTYTNKLLTAIAGSEAMPSGTYSYDSAGKITVKDNSAYTYGNSNCPVQITGTLIYSTTQDACGRMLSRTINGNTLDFAYAASGNLLSISSAGTALRTMLYDVDGKRIMETAKDRSTTIYLGVACVIHTDAAGNVTTTNYLTDALGIVASVQIENNNSTALFYRRDTKKNITHVYDNTATLQKAIVYDGFGAATVLYSAGDNIAKAHGPLYEGKSFDNETGLYYFNARYYDPVAGVFISPDSKLGAHSMLVPGAWNRFAFELNNPVNHTDPSGHWSVWNTIEVDIAVIVIVSVAVALTPVTLGASDVGGVAAVGALEGVEMTGVGAGAVDAGGVGVATEGGAAGGAAVDTGSSIGDTLLKMGTNALKGAVTGAATSSAEYLVESIHDPSNFSWSGLASAAEDGAISGAVSGAVTAGFSSYYNMGNYTLLNRVLLTGSVGAISSEAAYWVECGVTDQSPSIYGAGKALVVGFLSGAILNYGQPPQSASDPLVGFEMNNLAPII